MALDDTALKRTTPFQVPEGDLKILQTSLPAGILDSDEWRLELERRSFGNDSAVMVNDVLQSSQEMVEQYSTLALQVLAALGEFPYGTIPPSDIDVVMPTPPEIDDISGNKPARPDYPTPTITDPPTLRGDIQDPTMNPVVKPTIIFPDAPTQELVWSEVPYLSGLLDNLKAGLNDILINGGTGIDPAWEQAVFDRATARLDLTHEEKYNEAENYYASKGHVAPPGALIMRHDMLNKERLREEGLISSDIAGKQLEIAHDHKKFCQELSQKVEEMSMKDKSELETRALDAAKSTIELLYDKYKTIIEGELGKIEIYKTDVQAEATRVESIAAANKSLTDTLDSETNAWISRLNAEFGIIESIIKMYVADMGGYEAEVRAEAVRLNALVDRYKAQVGAAEVQGKIELGEYEALVKSILGEIDLALGSQKEAGRIAAQIVASALSAFNASASISDSYNKSKGYSENKGMSTSNAYTRSFANQLSISYGMDEQMSDRYNEAKEYTYSGAAP